ncbi:MAG: hypothetical protein Q7J11_01080, partial [Candidatus Roizmanbacteria bacterium]|nr:hypothetical protein [Candidatus Roizmanbacteria bacterium]
MKLLADQAIDDLFGGITPPAAMNIGGSDPVQGVGKFLAFGINMFILISGLLLLIYLLWGAFDWISSGGDKEKITKAQNKITNAIIGMLLIFVVLAVFIALAGNSLGIIRPNGSGG